MNGRNMNRNESGMIMIVVYALLFLALGVVTWLIVVPMLALFTTAVKESVKPIAEDIAKTTDNPDLINATVAFQESLDFQAQVLMFFAQYGWLIIAISFFLGVFMLTRTWIERQRGGIV